MPGNPSALTCFPGVLSMMRSLNRPRPLGACEWSSLKEVWAWVMRTKSAVQGEAGAGRARHSRRNTVSSSFSSSSSSSSSTSFPLAHATASSQQDASSWLAEFGGLAGLADALEHTSLGDSWLAGDGVVLDLPHRFLEDTFPGGPAKAAGKALRKRRLSSESPRELDIGVVLAALEAVELPENLSRNNVRQAPDQVRIVVQNKCKVHRF